MKPLVISTWKHGVRANEAAWKVLVAGAPALDAVEAGVRVTEADPEVRSVGYGGYPDEACIVTLDASIMGPDGNAGSVAFVQGYKHPVSIARTVMEESDNVMLAGAGAERFAERHGFEREELLTAEARQGYLEWKAGKYDRDGRLPPDVDHDTVGMIALDAAGEIAGACTTSGLAFKTHGRVGDSPLIGAAAATGRGEAIIGTCGSFLVVEEMRRGLHPQEAARKALERILDRHGGRADFQVAFVAVNTDGEIGALAIRENFQYALAAGGRNELIDSEHLF